MRPEAIEKIKEFKKREIEVGYDGGTLHGIVLDLFEKQGEHYLRIDLSDFLSSLTKQTPEGVAIYSHLEKIAELLINEIYDLKLSSVKWILGMNLVGYDSKEGAFDFGIYAT
ncbi:MAG: hypothetical protein QW331_03155 [Candidatus Woesearchaeota archaeon]